MKSDTQGLVKYFNQLAAIQVVINKPKNLKANNERILFEYRRDMVPEIFETAGASVGLPFREKKTTKWREYRAFPSAPAKLMTGVWSGETYEGLFKGEAAGSEVSIISKINSRQITFGFKADYRNVKIGLNDEFIKSQTEKSAQFFGNLAIQFLKDAGRMA